MTKKAKNGTTNGKTVKRNGISYTLITPSHLTLLKNKLKKALSIKVPVELPESIRLEDGPETIPGTTGTTFQVFASTTAGVAGFRNLGDGSFRVRVVPDNVKIPQLDGWPKHPDGHQNRYSTVVKASDLPATVAEAAFALTVAAAQ